MKQTSIYTLALAAALMLIPAACSDQQYDNGRTPGQQPGEADSLITVTATQGDRPQTRLGYVDPNDPTQPIAVTWAEGDKFYVGKDIYELDYGSYNTPIATYTSYFSSFTLTDGAGRKNADFTGKLPVNVYNENPLYGIYGDGTKSIKLYKDGYNKAALSFDYTNQVQSANNNIDHLSKADFMLGATTYATGKDPIFSLTRLGAMMKFTLTLPKADMEVMRLTLTTADGSKPFSDIAHWSSENRELNSFALSVSNTPSASTTLAFQGNATGAGITLAGTNVLTAYMMVAPTVLTNPTAPIEGKDLLLKVTDADGATYGATLKGAEIEQGKYYHIQQELTLLPTAEMRLTVKPVKMTSIQELYFQIPFPTDGTTTPADIEITVDWGDGSPVTVVPGGTPMTNKDAFYHKYKSSKLYTITLTSSQPDPTKQQIPRFHFGNRETTFAEHRNHLISMDTPMLNTGETMFNNVFDRCTNLVSLPKNLFCRNLQATTFSNCFSYCEKLVTLSENIFKNTQATTFRYCFSRCANLVSLPPGLFDNTPATNFEYCFSNCTSLVSLPPGLFDTNTQATTFEYCFKECTSLVSLPPGLFDTNTQVTSFLYCFNKCSSLASLPEGLFDKNKLATNFQSCFDSCTKLVLNEKIFSIDKDINRFKDKDMNFAYCFQNTGTALLYEECIGRAPKLSDYERGTGKWMPDNCFQNCKSDPTILAWLKSGWGNPKP